MNDLDRVQAIVGKWANETFPDADNDSITSHLTDEVEELANAAHVDAEGMGNIEEEAADCLLLLLHLAHRNGFSLFDAAAVKHSLNTARTWQTERNERGYYAHQD